MVERVSQAPTKGEIRAVRKALYRRDRLDTLKHLAREIARLMNFDPAVPLAANDVRNPPGSGPLWFLPATGEIDPHVLEAAHACDTVAATLRAIRHDVGQVTFPTADKQHLMASLDAEATSWTVRGAMWRAPGKPDVEAFVADVSRHVDRTISEAKHVGVYLKTKRSLGL
jgi:hypothetical protein